MTSADSVDNRRVELMHFADYNDGRGFYKGGFYKHSMFAEENIIAWMALPNAYEVEK